MPRNSVVEKYLYDAGYGAAAGITYDLIDGGFIEADKLSEPEILVERTKKWLGNTKTINPKDTFNMASGWSTDSWRIVVNNSYENHGEYAFNTPSEIKYIFDALVILAKEAGIEL